MTTYKQAKQQLKDAQVRLKNLFNTDKPAIRQGLNDYTDYLIREYRLNTFDQNRLVNYCCHLHLK